MRRKDREVTLMDHLLQIVGQCKICRIATQDEQGLYIVPLNFGYLYQGGKLTLFIHCAKEGRKVEAFRLHPEVAFEMDCAHRLIEAETACKYSYAYQSIIGNGYISLVEDPEEKKTALSALMLHQSGKEFTFDDMANDPVAVYRIEVTRISGKERF